MREAPCRDWNIRLKVFRDAGLIHTIPTDWQLLQGQVEMAPFVVFPDSGDQARYEGAPMSHPVVRTPLVFAHVGWEHFRVGHGLQSSCRALLRHLNIVQHEGMPVFDLQLVQTHPNGLQQLRSYLAAVDEGATSARRAERRLVDLVIPDAASYRRKFLEPDGWIDRAARFDYDEAPAVLRKEFASLVNFVNYCADAFPPRPEDMGAWRNVAQLTRLFTTRFRSAA